METETSQRGHQRQKEERDFDESDGTSIASPPSKRQRTDIVKAQGLANTRGASQLPNGKWRARVRLGGKTVHLGTFGTQEEAAMACENARNGSATATVTTPKQKSAANSMKKSKYPRGVSYTKYGTWQAQVYYGGKSHHIGTFATMEEASSAAETARENMDVMKSKSVISIGTRVCRPFFVDDKQEHEEWFEGKVTSYDKDLDLYLIEYEDGDAEELGESDLRALLALTRLIEKEPKKELDEQSTSHIKEEATTTPIRAQATTSVNSKEWIKAPDIGPGWAYKQYSANKAYLSPSGEYQMRSKVQADRFKDAVRKFGGNESQAFSYLQVNGFGKYIKKCEKVSLESIKDRPSKPISRIPHENAIIAAAAGVDDTKCTSEQKRLWEENFALLVDFKQRHKTTRVPYRYPKLGLWASKQRKEYREQKLSSYRIERMNSIGFVWEADKSRTRIVQHQDRNGPWIQQDGLIIKQEADSNQTQVTHQQARKGSSLQHDARIKQEAMLSEDEDDAARIEMPSVDWRMEENYNRSYSAENRSIWEKKFRLLMAFQKRTGTTRVPRTHRQLGHWAHSQRRNFSANKLCPYRLHFLNAINFTWFKKKEAQDHSYVEQYSPDVDSVETEEEGEEGEEDDSSYIARALSRNLNNQLYQKIDEVKDTDTEFDDTNCTDEQKANWETNFQLLVEYKNETGTTRVPRKEPTLGEWTKSQRRCYRENRLSKYRTNCLNLIGFWWNTDAGRAAGPILESDAVTLDQFENHKALHVGTLEDSQADSSQNPPKDPAVESVSNPYEESSLVGALKDSQSPLKGPSAESVSNLFGESLLAGSLKDSQTENSQNPPNGTVIEPVSNPLDASLLVGTLKDSETDDSQKPSNTIPTNDVPEFLAGIDVRVTAEV